MNGIDARLQYVSYGLAVAALAMLAILLVTSHRRRQQSGTLLIAVLASALWAGLLGFARFPQGGSLLYLFLIEIAHDGVWLVFLSAMLGGAVSAGKYRLVRYGGLALTAVLLAVGIGREILYFSDAAESGAGSVLSLASVITSLYALVIIEQIYRNAREAQRRGLKYLCIGVGSFFAYDLFLYSNAILTGNISELFWSVRGFVVAMCVPLIVVAAHRSPNWSAGVFVSRQIVFYTATLVGAGIYLTLVGLVGYYLRVAGGQWGLAAQVVLFSAATIGLFIFLFSDTTRARLRVFISKHFYQNKYDYREEWLRLIGTLTRSDETIPLRKRAMKALTQILDSPSAVMWLQDRESGNYVCANGWNMPAPSAAIAADNELVKFLRSTGWVIDVDEYRRDSSHYGSLNFDADAVGHNNAGFIVPLVHDESLLGFVVMAPPTAPIELNFEDRDLLKTAGRQIASYLAQQIATEQLTEARQFEAFNRLTAYLMHDLKNVVAQQSLLVENAQKHRDKPEFIDDALATIRGSVRRMRNVMEHLNHSPVDQRLERVELGKLIMQAVSHCADRKPEPSAHVGDKSVWIRADRDRLSMALHHAIRNAQDATTAEGKVTIHLETNGDRCTVSIADEGTGMTEDFIRDRLFRPFDSTKGTQGMGIGAYQIRETVHALGGDVRVKSQVGEGTCLVIDLRLAS